MHGFLVGIVAFGWALQALLGCHGFDSRFVVGILDDGGLVSASRKDSSKHDIKTSQISIVN
jgi:hypothetical protein